jgi:glutaredoxin
MPRIFIATLFCLVPLLAGAQQQLFRYVDKDGHVVYTDTAPPSDAKSVQQKKLGGNFIETSELPYALQLAQQRNPVTLYSGPCGDPCNQARALLNKRGVPYRDVDPSQPAAQEKLKQIAGGDLAVPVLVIGSANLLRGFEEGQWQAALDLAGYPKTPAARITAIRRETDKAGADKSAGKGDTKGEPKAGAKSDEKVEAKGEVKSDYPYETKK